MNKIPDIRSADPIWALQSRNPYRDLPAANESAPSELVATQRADEPWAVDVGGKRDPAAADESILTEESTELLAKKLNESLKHQDLEFSVDKDTGSTVITVTSRGTGEVVRQIPSEEILHLMRDVQQQAPESFEFARIFDQSV